jgi:hypothetical protein
LVNLPGSAARFYGGLVEAVANPVQTLQSVADVAAGGLRAGARAVLPRQITDAIDSLSTPESIARIAEAANAVGGEYAQNYGSAEGLRNRIATDPVAFLADVSMLLGGGAAVARRAGVTRTAGVLGQAERFTDPLAPLAAGIDMGARGGARAVEYARRVSDPVSAAYVTAAAGRGENIVNTLRDPRAEIVPGSRPPVSQIVAPAGSAEFTAFARSAEEARPTEMAERAAAQSRARLSYMREVSGAPPDVLRGRGGALESARDVRAAETAPLYAQALSESVPADPTIYRLLSRPSMEDALRRAASLAAEENRPFSVSLTPPSAQGRLLDAQGRPMTPTPLPGQYSVQDLNYVKRALDDLVGNPQTGLGAAERAAITATRREFMNWLDSQSPAYRQARQTYAAASVPIDQMEVGRYLESRLTQPLSGEATRANTFAQAVREAPTTLRRATGEARFSYLSDVLTPGQIRIVDNIRRDLAREEQANVLARTGRSAAPDAENVFSTATGPARVNMLDRVATVANMIVSRLQGALNREMAIRIAADLTDPGATANALERALAREARTAALAGGVRRAGEQAAGVVRLPAFRALPQVMNAMGVDPNAVNLNAMAP